MPETFYDVMRRQGITRRSFLKFCSLTAAAMGLRRAVLRGPTAWTKGHLRGAASVG